MADTVQTAIYAMGLNATAYERGMEQKVAADNRAIASGERVVTSEERVTRATRLTSDSIDRKIARLDPAYGAQLRYNRALEANTRYEEEGIGTAAQRIRLLELETERYQKLAGTMDLATGMATRNVVSTRQLSFQLVDIVQGIPLAIQSPLYGLQNIGFQLAQIGQLYAGNGGLKGALRDSIAQFASFGARLGPVALGLGAVALGFLGLQREINRTSDVSVGFVDTIKATFQVLGSNLLTAIRPALDTLIGWFDSLWTLVQPGVKALGNGLITGVVASVEVIKTAVMSIPDALQLAAETGANAFIAGIEGMVNRAIDGINRFIEAANKVPQLFGSDAALPTVGGVSLGRVDIGGAGAASRLAGRGGALNDTLGGLEGADYLGGLFEQISTKAEKLAKAREELEKTKKAANDNNKAMNEELGRVSQLYEQTRTPMEEYRERLMTLNALHREGAINQEIYGRASVMAAATIANQYGQIAGTIGQALGTIFEDSKAVSIANALINTYQGITQALAHYPPPFSYAMAAAQAALGFAQVAKIRSQSRKGGGGASSGIGGTAAGANAGNTQPQVARTVVLSFKGSPDDKVSVKDVRAQLEELSKLTADGAKLVVEAA